MSTIASTRHVRAAVRGLGRYPVLCAALSVAVALTLVARPASGATAQTGPTGRTPNVAIEAMAPGGVPPQFIVFSFDGSGSHEKWQEFLAVADEVGAQFTGFLTGTYLLTDEHAAAYTGPGHEPGKSSVGFGGTAAEVTTMITDLNTAYAAGNEIGSHFNGHFCDGNDPSGNDWTTAQWSAELDQFATFFTQVQTINALPAAPALTVPIDSVRGARTPCLEGAPEVVFPAMAAHGMTYDSSLPVTGLQWPHQQNGLWEFGMPVVPVPATGGRNIAMDYNFWVSLNGGADEPARAKEFTTAVLDTYKSMYDAAFHGNRAPLVIGNHFNDWNGNAFNPAIVAFMRAACQRPQTVCTTYENVIAWMQAQDPAVLAELIARPPVDTGQS